VIEVYRPEVSKVVIMPEHSAIELGSNRPLYLNVMLLLSPQDEQRGFSGYTLELTAVGQEWDTLPQLTPPSPYKTPRLMTSGVGQSEFTSITFPDWAVVRDVDPPKPSTVPMPPTPILTLRAADLNNMVQPGTWMIPLATTSVDGEFPGMVLINARVLKLDDEGGTSMIGEGEELEVYPAILQVYADVVPFNWVEGSSGVQFNPDYIYGYPTDPDQDLLYEDTNGNEVMDYADVVLYFQTMECIPKFEPVAFFDYNQNGRIDFADVIALFREQ
jgi:PKD repeat protein